MAKRITLIASDNMETTLVRDILEHRGFAVSRYRATIEFEKATRRAVRRPAPDLVVVDLRHETPEGLAFPSVIEHHENLRSTPLLALVGDPDMAHEAEAAGYDACLNMPFSLDEIWAAIRPYVGEE